MIGAASCTHCICETYESAVAAGTALACPGSRQRTGAHSVYRHEVEIRGTTLARGGARGSRAYSLYFRTLWFSCICAIVPRTQSSAHPRSSANRRRSPLQHPEPTHEAQEGPNRVHSRQGRALDLQRAPRGRYGPRPARVPMTTLTLAPDAQ